MSPLSPAERRDLKARAHHLEPIVMIGEAGLTPQVLHEIDIGLQSHELIKVRILGDDRAARETLAGAICDATGAHPVQQIGKMLVIYRRGAPDSQKKTPRRPKRKPARKTKRSFQMR